MKIEPQNYMKKNPIVKMKYNYISFYPKVCNLECS